MKKRILALALAGTTAFSVFGAAISANAAWTSTDTKYDVDAYKSYESVADTINVSVAGASTTNTVYYYKLADGSHKIGDKIGDLAALQKVYQTTTVNRANYTKVTYVLNTTSNGNVYVSEDGTKIVGTPGTGTLADTETYLNLLGIKKTSDGKYQIGETSNVFGTVKGAVDYLRTQNASSAPEEDVYYVYSGLSSVDADKKIAYTEEAYGKAIDNGILLTDTQYKDKYVFSNNEITPGSGTTYVKVDSKDAGEVSYTSWAFNGSMSDESEVYPFTTHTEVKKDKNGNYYLDVTKQDADTVYAYDFLPVNRTTDGASKIAGNWNARNEAATAASLMPYGSSQNTATLTAETGRGNPDTGIRYEVVSNWIDFLDNLAINADNGGYVESEAEFIKNYADMFYSDPVYDIWTGELVDYVSVDLYNIKGLLSDIYDLSGRYANAYKGIDAGWDKANTSELVYLMQQYNKYIGNYFDKTEVEGTEWGELMLSVLNAATEDNFKKASDYKKYMNKVDDLSDAYEEATTVGMIKEAEEGMYSLLTSAPYTAASSADKSELSATLGGLYFNAKSAPGVYSVEPSTADASRATYTNYNYYVAVVDTDAKDNPYAFSTTLKAGYYSLYPMADYIDNDTTTPNSNYNGNVASADFNGKYATEEYEWFWNVYQLAVKMSGTNKYQGAVDAINEALNDAVSNLTVTTTPSSSETAAVADTMEKYAGKIDTDYNEGYYAKYTQANDYAENVAEGKWQTRIAAMITGVSGEALTYQGTQVTVTKNDMKTVETAIKNGEAALKAIKEDANYNAAQVNALNKAINEAQTIVDIYEGTYSTSKNNQSVNKVYTRLVGDKDQIVKSDLANAIEAIDAAINYSEIIMGWSKNEASKWQYGTEEGYLNNGWNKIGKTWFYFKEDGTAMQSDWLQENGNWYWFNSNCGAATGWAKVDGEWYFFKGNNAMKTGWEKVDGNWYYMASSGKMVTGWCEIGGKWYYFSKESNSLGQMLYNTTVDGYKLDANGVWVK